MIVYKIIDEYSRESGKKVDTQKVFDFFLCDFTGEKINIYSNSNTYNINFQNNDPCFGDNEGERWLYNWNEDVNAYELFGQNDYIFKIEKNIEVFKEMVETALKEKIKIYSLDYLLRWSRGRMLEKVLKENKYELEQFLK